MCVCVCLMDDLLSNKWLWLPDLPVLHPHTAAGIGDAGSGSLKHEKQQTGLEVLVLGSAGEGDWGALIGKFLSRPTPHKAKPARFSFNTPKAGGTTHRDHEHAKG